MMATMITFPCPHCRKSLKASDEDAGKRCRCNGCGKTVNIPTDEPIPYERPAESEVPPMEYDYRHKGPGFIGVIQGFLIVVAVLLTVAVVIAEVYVLSHDALDVYRAFHAEKWYTFGFFVGVWFSGMVALATTYVLAEIARALRTKG
jgi:hypothetical protein